MSKSEEKKSEQVDDVKKNQHDQQIEELQKEIEKLKQDVASEKNAKLLALADFQNYKKRIEQERMAFMTMASKQLLEQIIEIIADFERAEESDHDDQTKMLAGFAMVMDKMHQILKMQNIEVVPIKKGDKFDPNFMEAITAVPVQNPKEAGKVVHVEQKAYKNSNDNTIFKQAKVIIGKN